MVDTFSDSNDIKTFNYFLAMIPFQNPDIADSLKKIGKKLVVNIHTMNL